MVVGVERRRTVESKERLEGEGRPPAMATPAQAQKPEVGPCLMVRGYLGGTAMPVILDSGAGVSIAGRQFAVLYKQTFGQEPPTRPISLTVTGIHSASSIAASLITSFPLQLTPDSTPLRVSAVMVREWEGGLLIGWRNLKSLGFNLALDAEGIPNRVRFARLGVECELMEGCSEEVVHHARAVGEALHARLDEAQRTRLDELHGHWPLQRRVGGGLASNGGHSEEAGVLGSDNSRAGVPAFGPWKEGKRRERAKAQRSAQRPAQAGRDRRPIWRSQLRARWQAYKRGRAEDACAKVALATAERLQSLADRKEDDPSDGWTISEEGLLRLTERKWPQPTLLAGRFAGRAVMDFLKAEKKGVIVFPWSDVTAGHVLEAMDHTDAIPLLVPSIHMRRVYGSTITKRHWVAMRIAGPSEAAEWRKKSKEFFRDADSAAEVQSIKVIAGIETPLLDESEIDPKGQHPAAQLYRALKDTILGEAQPFSSMMLPQDDQQEEEISWQAFEPPPVDSKGAPKVHGSRASLAQYLKGRTDVPRSELLDICWKYRGLFDEIRPGSVRGHVHRIDLNTSKVLRAKVYPLRGESQKEAARSEIQRLLKGGMISEVTASAFQAPIVMAPKKAADGGKSWRFCCDFRLLNEHTVSDKYPMPSLEQQLDIGKAKFFTKMDLASAFWQIPIAPEDQLKTTFHFEGRSYKWVVMPFGLKNAPPTFQRLVDKVLSGLLGRGVYAYIDDILVYTETLEEHWTILTEVLERLQAAGLKVSLDKSEWIRKQVQYLGYVIGEGVLKMDPSKVGAILKIPTPQETMSAGHYKPNLRKQVRRFLGAAGFYRRFIRDFATLTAPLTELTKEKEHIRWSEEHTRAWRALQESMASYPVLRQPDTSKEFFVDTDASNVGLGAALMQRGEDGTPHPVAYASRKLTPVEQTYSTREQEALAIVFAIEKFDCFLAGRRFTVVTDHRSLSWLMTQPLVKGRLANWAYKLRSHDFTIVYRKGSENHLADFLSRAVHMVQVLIAQVPSGRRVAEEAERIVALDRAMRVVDQGKPRPSKPARTISLQESTGRKRGTQASKSVGLPLRAHPAMMVSLPLNGEGEGIAGALPCLVADAKVEVKAEAEGKAEAETEAKAEAKGGPEEDKVAPVDAKVEAKAEERKRLVLTPEEQREVSDWLIPGAESWRIRLRGDPGLGPLLQYLTDDPALGPGADLKELERHAALTAVEKGLLVRRVKGKHGEPALALVVPNLTRTDLLTEAHDREHRSADHTYTTLKEARYWWPKMQEDVRSFCRSCIVCRAAEAGKAGKGLWVGWGIEPRRFEIIHIDFAGPLTKSARGNSYVLSLVDRATGWVEMVPTQDRTSASAVKALLGVWIPRYGVPKSVISDNGSHFTSAEFAETCAEYQIRLKTVVPYHPQANGIVERRFRDMNKAVRIFSSVEKDWEEILPQFVFGTRNIANSVTGFSPSELVFGEKIRHPLSLDGNFNRFYDQATELARTLYRLNLVEQVIADKRLSLHHHSSEKAAERFDVRDYEVGHEVFTHVDEPPRGVVRREFIPWEGPFPVVEVRPLNLVIQKFGHLATVNKTKCIRVVPLELPERDVQGRPMEGSPEYKALQDKVLKDKISYLKKKIAGGESAPIGPVSAKAKPSKEGKGSVEEPPGKVPHVPPSRVIAFRADDLKVGNMVVVHLQSKKGNYLAEVRKVWLPLEEAPGETEKWIRVHLWGRTEPKAETFAPWWIDGKRRCYLKPASSYGELWEDVYASWVRYRLKHPVRDGRIHQEDEAQMKALWGRSLRIA